MRKRPLVSQLLHSEQAPKWCIVICPDPNLGFVFWVLPLESTGEEKIPIATAIKLYTLVSDVRQIISTKLNGEIRGKFDRKMHSTWHERVVVHRSERENMKTLFVKLQRASTWQDYRSLRTTRRVLGTAINLEESMLAQLFLLSTLIAKRDLEQKMETTSFMLASKSLLKLIKFAISQVIDDE